MTITTTRSDGSVEHRVTPSDSEFDTVLIRHSPDEPETFNVTCYVDDEVVEQFTFQTRQMSFKPLSLLGRGTSETLQGVSTTDDTDDPIAHRDEIPATVRVAFESMGLTVVPRGTEWLDGE